MARRTVTTLPFRVHPLACWALTIPLGIMGAALQVYAEEGGSVPAASDRPAATAPSPSGAAATPTAPPPTASPAPADGACERALHELGDGKLNAFTSLPPDGQAALLRNPQARALFTCLAVADGKTSFCDTLNKQDKNDCLDQLKLMGELKTLPKEEIKAQIMYRVCSRGVPGEVSKQDCDTVRSALKAHDASLCKRLSKPEGAWGRVGLCPALASGDATKCNGAHEQAQRDSCAALVTDDPKRCPKNDPQCSSMVNNLLMLQKDGLDSGELDPVLAAVRAGRKACAPLVAAVEQGCRSSAPGPGAPTDAPAASSKSASEPPRPGTGSSKDPEGASKPGTGSPKPTGGEAPK
jgi:hypothetical protein